MMVKDFILTILEDYLKNCLERYVKCDYYNMFFKIKIS